MAYYTSFDAEGFSTGFMNVPPDPEQGLEVELYEIEELPESGVAFKDSDGTIRAATLEDLADRFTRLGTAVKATDVRNERNALLSGSDKLVAVDRWEKYSDERKAEISEYRQALRDIPLQQGFPLQVVFPELPFP